MCQEALELEVLLDPLEEQLDLPAALVDVGDGLGGEVFDVGQELVIPAGVGAGVADQPHGLQPALGLLLSAEAELSALSP